MLQRRTRVSWRGTISIPTSWQVREWLFDGYFAWYLVKVPIWIFYYSYVWIPCRLGGDVAAMHSGWWRGDSLLGLAFNEFPGKFLAFPAILFLKGEGFRTWSHGFVLLYVYLRPGTEWKFPYWAFAGFLDARRRVLFSNGVAVSVVRSDSSGRVKASALFFFNL